ncbi:19953_t:CDS:2, partial [Gigaspora rosea]
SIRCIDGITEKTYILCTHILSWSGNTLALIKVICITEHNSYKAYQFCSFCETHESYLQDVTTIEYLNRLLCKYKVQER